MAILGFGELFVPDQDNLSRSLPKAWSGARRAALGGPKHLGKYLASITVQELPQSKGIALLDTLADQLKQIAEQSIERRMVATLELPDGSERCRDTEIALHAAERVLVEIVTSDEEPPITTELRQKLYEEFCVEIPKVYCLGVLAIKHIPTLYSNTAKALRELKRCEQTLRQMLKPTARELAENPMNPTLTKIPKPRLSRPSQEELVGSPLKLNLGILEVEEE